MENLVQSSTKAFDGKTLHPLLVTALFIVEFLAIQPFQDGNGRLSRVLTTYFLLKSGYSYVPFSSLEAVIKQNKENYYLSLRQTQGTLKMESPNWEPWVLYFLKALKHQKQLLETKLERGKILMSQLPELSLQILELAKTRGRITVREIVSITNANRNTVKKQLEALVDKNYLLQSGIGKGTWYMMKG